MSERIYNFSAGPAVLPLTVLQEAQKELLNLSGVGMSILEISHRSATFEAILKQTESDLRELYAVPSNYQVLFLQGGASLQFSMVPMNFLPKGRVADYILTGVWSEKALEEAKKIGETRVAGSTKEQNYNQVPSPSDLRVSSDAVYAHYTSNNTIFGTQWSHVPQVGAIPLVCDMSSDLMYAPVDISKFALIYGGAQKNLGPSGVTIVIIRDDLLERVPKGLPVMLDYKVQADNKSLYNTPPVFSIYIVGLVLKWIKAQGGLAKVRDANQVKAKLLYDTMDQSGGYYKGHAVPGSRSLMNVTFRLPSEDLEKKFVKESTAAHLDGLKGHRLVGGLRASIYNAFPLEGVQRLVEFMGEFQKKNPA